MIDGLPADQHNFGMQQGHSPLAHHVVMIDFDGTIVPWGPLMGPKEPFPEVAEAMRNLRKEGFTIVIFSSRLSPRWCAHAGTDPLEQREYIETILDAHDIPFQEVTAEKLPAEVYFDDKAVFVLPGTLAKEINHFLASIPE